MGIIKLAIKVGLASTAVYYVSDQGIWRNSSETEKTCQVLKKTLSPYVKQATEQLPFELPTLPESEQTSSLIKQSWNCAVLSTFKFLADLPEHGKNVTKKGVDKLLENQEIQNFVNSFKGGNLNVEKK